MLYGTGLLQKQINNLLEQQLLFCVKKTEKRAPNDDSVRLLSHELEDLDYTKLYQAYSAKGRNPAVDPKTMFKAEDDFPKQQ